MAALTTDEIIERATLRATALGYPSLRACFFDRIEDSGDARNAYTAVRSGLRTRDAIVTACGALAIPLDRVGYFFDPNPSAWRRAAVDIPIPNREEGAA